MIESYVNSLKIWVFIIPIKEFEQLFFDVLHMFESSCLGLPREHILESFEKLEYQANKRVPS